MSGPGFDAQPISPRQMAFLMHRGLSMGVPASRHAGVGETRWEPDDLAGFFSRREWIYKPLTGSTVRVVADHHGHTVETCGGAVLGPMPDPSWPESGKDPWLLSPTALLPGGVVAGWGDADEEQAGPNDRSTSRTEPNRLQTPTGFPAPRPTGTRELRFARAMLGLDLPHYGDCDKIAPAVGLLLTHPTARTGSREERADGKRRAGGFNAARPRGEPAHHPWTRPVHWHDLPRCPN